MSYQEQLSIPSSPTSETVKACSIGLHPPMRFYNDSFPIQSILWPQKSFCANVSGFCGLLKPQENVRTSEAVRRFPGQGYRSARLSPVPPDEATTNGATLTASAPGERLVSWEVRQSPPGQGRLPKPERLSWLCPASSLH